MFPYGSFDERRKMFESERKKAFDRRKRALFSSLESLDTDHVGIVKSLIIIRIIKRLYDLRVVCRLLTL